MFEYVVIIAIIPIVCNLIISYKQIIFNFLRISRKSNGKKKMMNKCNIIISPTFNTIVQYF